MATRQLPRLSPTRSSEQSRTRPRQWHIQSTALHRAPRRRLGQSAWPAKRPNCAGGPRAGCSQNSNRPCGGGRA
eukprot:7779035-Alexandrium_andersonii.AAC.1